VTVKIIAYEEEARRAVTVPLKQIARNAGLEGGVVVEKVRTLPVDHGLDAATGGWVDMLATGIIDPSLAPPCTTRRPSPACSSPQRP